MDLCYRLPIMGYPVCMFLKRHATPEFFAIIGNSSFEAFFAKVSGSALKAVSKPVAVTVGVALGADYVVSTTGGHQLAQHAAEDYYNGQKTVFKADLSLNKRPFIEQLAEIAVKK